MPVDGTFTAYFFQRIGKLCGLLRCSFPVARATEMRLEAARTLSDSFPHRTKRNSYDPTRPSKGWRSAFEAILLSKNI
ncbi:MAG: hypothetical protein DMG72_15390 [Acidobacteria bacterium]|nr:MAG: hypothetical protein DMG72_15390 [Acidobacteriota bacterium]